MSQNIDKMLESVLRIAKNRHIQISTSPKGKRENFTELNFYIDSALRRPLDCPTRCFKTQYFTVINRALQMLSYIKGMTFRNPE